jgi:hypothetical protein
MEITNIIVLVILPLQGYKVFIYIAMPCTKVFCCERNTISIELIKKELQQMITKSCNAKLVMALEWMEWFLK